LIRPVEVEGGAYVVWIPSTYFPENDAFNTDYSYEFRIQTSDPIVYLSQPSGSEVVMNYLAQSPTTQIGIKRDNV
jgi:hypothetical protein